MDKTLIGTSIGNYEIVDRIGSGAMGMVFEGVHPQIGKRVAIKVLAPHLTHVKSITHRFIQEAKTINKIEHPNIIEIFDFGQLPDERYYYSMELLQGENLSDILKQRNLPMEEILEITGEVCDALEAVHEQGIIHRDLKPGNIFLARKGRKTTVKVLDFGVAKLLEPGAESEFETSAGSVLGTPVYMAPEQAMGKISEIHAGADIYSIGVVVYRMLTGLLPVFGKNIGEIISNHLTKDVVPPSQINPAIPEQVSAVLLRCVAKDPASRYPTAWAFFQDFKDAVKGIPGDTVFNLRPPRASRAKGDDNESHSRDYYYSFNSDGQRVDAPASESPISMHDTAVSESNPPPPPSMEEMSHPSQFEYSQFPAGAYVETHISASGQGRGRLPIIIGGAVAGVAVLVVAVIFLLGRSSGSNGSGDGTPAKDPPAPKTVIAAMKEPVSPPPAKKPALVLPMVAMKVEVVKVRLSAWSTTEGVKASVTVGDETPADLELPFVRSLPKGARVVIKATKKGFKPTTVSLTVDKDTKQQIKMSPVVIYHRPAAMKVMAKSVGDGLL